MVRLFIFGQKLLGLFRILFVILDGRLQRGNVILQTSIILGSRFRDFPHEFKGVRLIFAGHKSNYANRKSIVWEQAIRGSPNSASGRS